MSFNLQELQEYISLAKDIVTILSALTAAIIAVLGLHTWKKQLKGKTEYELARKLLRAVYKVRDAIRLVRNAFMSAGEISQSLQEANIKTDQFAPRFDAISQGALYQRRWEKVQDALSELDLEAFEAEVIWGREVREKLKPLRKNVSTLLGKIQLYLELLKTPHRDTSNERIVQELVRVIHEVSEDPSKDSFTAEITGSVRQIEDYLKPHLKL